MERKDWLRNGCALLVIGMLSLFVPIFLAPIKYAMGAIGVMGMLYLICWYDINWGGANDWQGHYESDLEKAKLLQLSETEGEGSSVASK